MIRSILGATAGGLAIVAFAALWLQAMPVKAGECGKASWYGAAHQGLPMANGKPFNRHKLTGASFAYPLGSVLSVRNVQNGHSVQITVTDRGPAKRLHRLVDLSEASFARLADPAKGVIRVCVTKLH